tara:strand:+ start:325 stop:588 length:264 start_codon:yes stop_codon:yes gene_type:complete
VWTGQSEASNLDIAQDILLDLYPHIAPRQLIRRPEAEFELNSLITDTGDAGFWRAGQVCGSWNGLDSGQQRAFCLLGVNILTESYPG